jgi:hypothetical protein
MKKTKTKADDGMLPEYDFSGAVRGKYYDRVQEASNIVVLDPDVSAVFPNAAAVNDALRGLASVARRSVRAAAKPRSTTRRRSK